jgi:Mrp family chromosome partitioning ATPase
MSDVNLTTFGIPPIDPSANPDAYAAVLAVARRLRHCAQRVVGFFPAEPRVAVPPLLVQLALALNDRGTVPVTLIDTNLRFPAFHRLAAGRSAVHSGLAAVELGPSLDLLTPCEVNRKPFSAKELVELLERLRERCRHVLLDLTGLDHDLPGFDFVDAAVLVAHSRTTHEYALTLAARKLPRDRQLGVLFVG